jgi:hypothetical protein
VRNNKLRLSRLGPKILTGRLASALVGKSSKIQYFKETQSQKPDGRNSMHYKPKSTGALQIALGGLPDRMRIEVEAGIAVSAKTVGELRKATSWPEHRHPLPTETVGLDECGFTQWFWQVGKIRGNTPCLILIKQLPC